MKAGVVEVAHGFWRSPQVAALCERLGPAAGAYVLMAEAYALEALPDGDFGRVSRETLASRCWFCCKADAGAILSALEDLGFLVAGKLAGWAEKVEAMRQLSERRRRAGAAGGKARARNEAAAGASDLLQPMGVSAAADEAKSVCRDNGVSGPDIQAEKGVSGVGVGGRVEAAAASLPVANVAPLAPVAPAPAPVAPRLTKAEHAAILAEPPTAPTITFAPLPPPPRLGKDRQMLGAQIADLEATARKIKDKAIEEGRPYTPEDQANIRAIKHRINDLTMLAAGMVPAGTASPAPAPARKTRRPKLQTP